MHRPARFFLLLDRRGGASGRVEPGRLAFGDRRKVDAAAVGFRGGGPSSPRLDACGSKELDGLSALGPRAPTPVSRWALGPILSRGCVFRPQQSCPALMVSPFPSRPRSCWRRRPWRLPGGSRPRPRERGASGCFPPEALGLSRDARRGGSGDQQAETICDSVAQVFLQAVRCHHREAYISTELTERRVTRPETTRMYAFVAV